MKKLLLLAAFAAMTVTAANAQWNLNYQGDVELGYSIGSGRVSWDRVNIHTTHGIRFNEYFFVGLGTGLDIYTTGGTELALPIYFNVKGYLPVSSRMNLFAGLDIGASVGLSKGFSGSGLLAVPQAGIAYKLNSGNALTFAFGYTVQKWSEKIGRDRFSVNTNAFTLKLGFQF